MSEIQDTDLFLVNRSGTSYKVQSDELLDKLKDNDLMLVNRDDQSYKITGAEFSGSFSQAPAIASVILTEDDNKGDRFTDETFTTTVEISGTPTPAKGIQATVQGNIEVTPETSEIVGVVNDSNAKTATLTLATNKDLVLFEQGDIVYQDNAGIINAPLTGTYPAYFINAATGTYFTTLNVANMTFVANRAYNSSTPWTSNPGDGVWIIDFTIPTTWTMSPDDVSNSDVNSYVLYGSDTGLPNSWDLIKVFGLDGVPITPSTPYRYVMYGVANSTTDLRILRGLVCDLDISNALSVGPSGIVSSVDTSTQTMTLANVVQGDGSVDYDDSISSNTGWNGNNIGANVFDGSLTSYAETVGDTPPGIIVVDLSYYPGTITTLEIQNRPSNSLDGPSITVSGDGITTTQISGDQFVNIPVTGNVGIIQCQNPAETGQTMITAIKVNGTQLVSGGPVWSANTGNYAIGPEKISENAQLYCKLDENLKVIDLQSSDPGYTDFVGNSPQITFPALFPDGKAPDTVLPVGTQMQTKVQATNANGTVTAESNTITPQKEVVNVPIHGVRGVPSRKTSLIAQKSINFSNETAGSMALWFKPSILTETQTLFSASSDFLVRIQDSKLYFKSGGSSDLAVVDVTKNVWQQVVMSFDANGSEAWLNGVSVGTSSVKPTASSAQYTLLCEAQDLNHFDGYLSQAVFIVGQKLDATVFGEDIDGKWAPKTTAGIITRVDLDGGFGLAGYFLPFAPIGVDYTKNTIGIDYQGPLNNIYNGKVSFTDDARIGLSGRVTLTAAKDIPCTDLVSVYYSSGSLLHPRTLTLNKGLADEAVFTMQTNNGIAVTKADFEFNGIIKTIEFRADAYRDDTEYVSPAGLYGFAVDNDILIDHKGVGADVSGSHTNFTSANMQLFAAPAVPGDDSVLDNPTSNYATLQFGTNGNLTATGQSDLTWRGYDGIFYHYEEDGIARFHRGGGTFRSVAGKTYNFGAQPFTKAIPQDYGVLVQTWEEWNFDSLNLRIPGDIAVFNTIKTALKNYEGDRDTFRANLKTTLQNQGITANQIASLGL